MTVKSQDNLNKHRVEVRILSPGNRAQSVQSHFETWFVPDGSDLVFRSALSPELSISEHLKLFYGMLQFHRKFIRQLEESGIRVTIRISVRQRSSTIEPEYLLFNQAIQGRAANAKSSPKLI